MRKTFPGYYRPTDAEFKKLWTECLFVLDANVLLNLYRYSPETRKKLIDTLQRLEARLWVPHQAALEYQRNRLEVISAQTEAYNQIEQLLGETQKKMEAQLNSYRRHPLINVDKLLTSIDGVFKSQSKLLVKAREKHPDLISDDPVRETLTKILEGKVGPAYPAAKLKEIFKEGAERYAKSMPPGYRDAKSKEGDRAFGDLILWFQIIDKAEKEKLSIIIVTDDIKDDWWWKHEGKIVGPHPELVAEIKGKAGVEFYMYESDQFMKFARQLFKEDVDQGAINEIRQVRAQERARLAELDQFLRTRDEQLIELEGERRRLEEAVALAEAETSSLSAELDMIRTSGAREVDNHERLNRLASRQEEMSARLTAFQRRRREIEFKISNLRSQRNMLIHQGKSLEESRRMLRLSDLMGQSK
jgi:hypothetical protein